MIFQVNLDDTRMVVNQFVANILSPPRRSIQIGDVKSEWRRVPTITFSPADSGASPAVSAAREFPAEIIQEIDEASMNPDWRDDDEPAPTAIAVVTAKTMVNRAAFLRRGFHIRAHVRPFNGSIRITWETSSRNIRLVCNPSQSDPPYIYWERLAGRCSIDHGIENATPAALSRRLGWLSRASI
jgi:hypothetical protein